MSTRLRPDAKRSPVAPTEDRRSSHSSDKGEFAHLTDAASEPLGLDDTRTFSGRGEWRATLYAAAGEGSLVRVAPTRLVRSRRRGTRDRDPLESAKSRAKRKAERFACTYRLRLFVTLTYATPPRKEATVRRHVRSFLAEVERRHGSPVPWLYVVESGKSGRLHVHLLMPASLSRSTLRGAWRRGFVTVRKLRDHGDVRARVAYTMKETRTSGEHRYSRPRGRFPDEAPLRLDPVAEFEDAWAQVLAAMGEAPDEVHTSEDWPGWRGPPLRKLRWWQARRDGRA